MEKTHYLKIYPDFFDAVKANKKHFEIIKNDRDFGVGDIVVLCKIDIENADKELDPSQVNELDKIEKRISYLTDYEQRENFVVLSLEDLGT